jgi:hypothetical protein
MMLPMMANPDDTNSQLFLFHGLYLLQSNYSASSCSFSFSAI